MQASVVGRQGLLIHWTALPRGTVSMTEEVGHSRCLVLNKSLTNKLRKGAILTGRMYMEDFVKEIIFLVVI